MSKIYDVIILGAGPAGLTAGLYAGRSRLSTLIIEKGQTADRSPSPTRSRTTPARWWRARAAPASSPG